MSKTSSSHQNIKDSSLERQKQDLFQPDDSHLLLRQTMTSFVEKEVEKQALQHDREEKFNLKLFKKMGELGLLGLTVDPKWGGSGMDAVSAMIVHEELSSSDPGLCLSYLAHTILCVHNISINANAEQKNQWLPKLCSGEWIGAMAMSEADAGTDLLSMKTNWKKQDNIFLINGRKMWITNGIVDDEGTLADCVLLYAISEDKKISTFLVQKDFTGFAAGQKIKDKTGMRASNTAELVFNNCQVPTDHLIGKAGESLTHMMRNLEIERLSLAAMSLGIAKRCLKEMNRYASERITFKKPIRDHGQIQKHLSESYAEYMACRTYIYHIANQLKLDKAGQRLSCDSAKLIAAQMGKKVADRAIQVLGGYGYVGEYKVERLWRDAKLLEIGGGTNEALEKNITKELQKYLL